MTQCSICYDDVIDYPAPEGTEATGSHRSSCGHIFHPKCISKWHVSQEESTCPMCRKKATEMEDCSLRDAQEESEGTVDEEEDLDDVIRITRVGMDYIIRSHGGMGVVADVEARLEFDQFSEVTIAREHLAQIMAQQGATPLSDEQWTRLTTIYPSAEPEEDAEPADLPRFGGLTFAMWDPEDYRSILGRANLDPLDDDEDDMSRMTRIVVDVEHQPGPFDFEYEGARFTLRRADIQRLLQERGSLATMVEFFNEEGEDPGAETLVVTMTLESLNARFASLGASPVSFMDAQRVLEARPRVILNPEDY